MFGQQLRITSIFILLVLAVAFLSSRAFGSSCADLVVARLRNLLQVEIPSSSFKIPPGLEIELDGPVLSAEQAPALYELFTKPYGKKQLSILNRLDEGQARLQPKDALAVNRFAIVDSLNVRAFAMTENRAGTQETFNTVYVTKGMINFMTGVNPIDPKSPRLTEKRFKAGFDALIGVLEHEYSHPLDLTNDSSQAIEIRTDIRGALLGSEVGLPPNGGYKALSRLKRGSRNSDTTPAIKAYLADHPVDDARLSTQRSFLTFHRYEFGENTEVDDTGALLNNFREVRSELEDSSYRSSFWQPTPPSSFEDALDKLERLGQQTDRKSDLEGMSDRKRMIGNQLLFSVLSYLKDPAHTSERLRLLFDRFSKDKDDFGRLSQLSTIDSTAVETIIRKHGLSNAPGLQSAMTLLNEDPFFKSEEYLRAIEQETQALTKKINGVPLRLLLPRDRLKRFLGHDYKNFLQLTETHSNGLGRQWAAANHISETEEIWRLGELYENVIKTAPPQEREALLLQSVPINGTSVNRPRHSNRGNPRLRGQAIERLIKLAQGGDVLAAQILSRYQALTKDLLNYKGEIAFLEYAGKFQPDWQNMAKVSNIEPTQLYRTIQDDFKNIITSPDRLNRVEITPGLANHGISYATSYLVQNLTESRDGIPWLAPGVDYTHEIHALGKDPRFKDHAIELAQTTVRNDGGGFESLYEQALTKILSSIAPGTHLDQAHLYANHLLADDELFPTRGSTLHPNKWSKNIRMIQMRVILKSRLTADQKRSALKALFLEDPSAGDISVRTNLFPENWKLALSANSGDSLREIYQGLDQVGLTNHSPIEFTEFWRYANTVEPTASIEARKFNNRNYYALLRTLAPILRHEWENKVSVSAPEERSVMRQRNLDDFLGGRQSKTA
jgi:hypothetical protein